MTVKFTVPGDPMGWQRSGANKRTGAIYKQVRTKNYQELVAMAYMTSGALRFPKGTAVEMRVYAYYPIPKSAAKKKRQQMLDGEIRPTVKPDFDNVAKNIADALNDVAYDDDKCIVDGMVRKYYSDNPRVEVVLREAREGVSNGRDLASVK